MAIGTALIYETRQIGSSANSITVDITTLPSAGDCILAFICNENPSGGYIPSTTIKDQNGDDFTVIQSDSSGPLGGACGELSYKVADGDETSVTVQVGGYPTATVQSDLIVLVVPGAHATTPVDVSTENTTYVGALTTTASSSISPTISSGKIYHFLSCERSLRWSNPAENVTTTAGTIINDISRTDGICGVVVVEQDIEFAGTHIATLSCDRGDEVYLAAVAIAPAAATGVTLTAVTGTFEYTDYAATLTSSAAPNLTLTAATGVFISTAYNTVLAAGFGGEFWVLSPVTGSFSYTEYDAVFGLHRVLTAEPGTFLITPYPATLTAYGTLTYVTYTYLVTEGSGTTLACVEDATKNASTAASWVLVPSNNRRYPVNDGTGATITETVGGYNATIQNYTAGGWG